MTPETFDSTEPSRETITEYIVKEIRDLYYAPKIEYKRVADRLKDKLGKYWLKETVDYCGDDYGRRIFELIEKSATPDDIDGMLHFLQQEEIIDHPDRPYRGKLILKILEVSSEIEDSKKSDVIDKLETVKQQIITSLPKSEMPEGYGKYNTLKNILPDIYNITKTQYLLGEKESFQKTIQSLSSYDLVNFSAIIKSLEPLSVEEIKKTTYNSTVLKNGFTKFENPVSEEEKELSVIEIEETIKQIIGISDGYDYKENISLEDQENIFKYYLLCRKYKKSDINYNIQRIALKMISDGQISEEKLVSVSELAIELIKLDDSYSFGTDIDSIVYGLEGVVCRLETVDSAYKKRALLALLNIIRHRDEGAGLSSIFGILDYYTKEVGDKDVEIRDLFQSTAKEIDLKITSEKVRYSYYTEKQIAYFLKSSYEPYFPNISEIMFQKVKELIEKNSDGAGDFFLDTIGDWMGSKYAEELLKYFAKFKYSNAKKIFKYLKSLKNEPLNPPQWYSSVYETVEKTISEDESSVVTKAYLQKFENIDLAGNPDIKQVIQDNLVSSEIEKNNVYRKLAEEDGLGLDEFKEKIQNKIEQVVSESNFFRATKIDVLNSVLNIDGRYKSQFETGTSEGSLNKEARATAELKMFGFNSAYTDTNDSTTVTRELQQENKENRPIYGFFTDDPNGVINSEGKIPPPCSVSGYGKVNVKIKRDRALKKATILFTDSLGSKFRPTPAALPHFTSFPVYRYGMDRLKELSNSRKTSWGDSYTEVQYHNQLTIDDIESIHISSHNSMSNEEMERVREIYLKFISDHPESDIKLVEY